MNLEKAVINGITDLCGIQLVNGYLVVSISSNVDEQDLALIQSEILENIKKLKVGKVVIDLSSVRVMDLPEFEVLKETAQMISILGSQVVLVGIQPGVASSLIDFNADPDGIITAVNINDGMKLLLDNIARKEEGEP